MFSTGPERQHRPAGRRTRRGETMTQDVHDTLASWFDSYAVEMTDDRDALVTRCTDCGAETGRFT